MGETEYASCGQSLPVRRVAHFPAQGSGRRKNSGVISSWHSHASFFAAASMPVKGEWSTALLERLDVHFVSPAPVSGAWERGPLARSGSRRDACAPRERRPCAWMTGGVCMQQASSARNRRWRMMLILSDLGVHSFRPPMEEAMSRLWSQLR